MSELHAVVQTDIENESIRVHLRTRASEKDELETHALLSGTFESVVSLLEDYIRRSPDAQFWWYRRDQPQAGGLRLGPEEIQQIVSGKGLQDFLTVPPRKVIVHDAYIPLRAGLDEAVGFIGETVLLRRQGQETFCPFCGTRRRLQSTCTGCQDSTLHFTPMDDDFVSVRTEDLLATKRELFYLFFHWTTKPEVVYRTQLQHALDEFRKEVKELQ